MTGVGASVGAGVGAFVGEGVGAGVGTFVGAGVGAMVGSGVGLGVGGPVGAGVGGLGPGGVELVLGVCFLQSLLVGVTSLQRLLSHVHIHGWMEFWSCTQEAWERQIGDAIDATC